MRIKFLKSKKDVTNLKKYLSIINYAYILVIFLILALGLVLLSKTKMDAKYEGISLLISIKSLKGLL